MSERRVTVTDCPGGPLLVRGADEVVAPDGTTAPTNRAVVALCRCNRSERMPWCDTSHRKRRRPRSTDDGAPDGTPDQASDHTDDDTDDDTGDRATHRAAGSAGR
ncbi:CDGSH iron-sulfur domain-containing protein [Nocardioides sp. zg-536]|uniref:CDGSH iron-sulfur domain-containing protein n=1 Tax=Nocardioides faecalis TaxID=2803858 RepID=A0A939BX92_9ACTN|nr:CDGSH iron-sulfur domain-containing protein [Nocardioides faecalis]MBM9461472.1 CDGSH iron-sulfur domain-containing protein [Nocardioides faecalis]QVI59341.1 CDGSH iron-sulfur domain-containing protein [Nocardioides faecalis]